MIYDYAVIGAGAAGMSAALVLAKLGATVVLIEKSPQLAPLLRGFSRHGVYFDTGFHSTGGWADGGPLQVLLRYLGIADQLQLAPYRADEFDGFHCTHPHWQFQFPQGWVPLEERLRREFPSEQVAIRDYLRTIRTYYQSLPYVNVQAAFDPTHLLPEGLELTLTAFLDRLTANAKLKAVLSCHWVLHGVVPDEVPLYAHARVVASSYGGAVNGVRGGGQSLVNAFSRQLAQLGVTIHCGVGVTGIKFSAAGTVAGVQTDNGADVECRACVSTVHPRYLADLVPEALFRPAYRARLKTSQETLSALILYAACDTTPEALRGRNLVVVSDLEHVASRHEAAFEEQPLFLAGASPNADGKPNPGGFLAICPMAYADLAGWSDSTTGKRPAGYTDYKARLTDRLWHRITAVCPAITAHLTHLEAATPLTLRDYVHTPLGSLYGVKYMTGDHLLGPRTRAAGLYLAGQSILAPGIAGAIVSSFLTCGTIIGHERMLKELQAWH